MVEERLGDMLHWKKDDIAVSLGIHPKTEGEWTGEEAARIVAECDRLYRASIISVLVQPPALPTAAPGIIRRRPHPRQEGPTRKIRLAADCTARLGLHQVDHFLEADPLVAAGLGGLLPGAARRQGSCKGKNFT